MLVRHSVVEDQFKMLYHSISTISDAKKLEDKFNNDILTLKDL